MFDSTEYIHRVNGIPLYYNGLRTPYLHHSGILLYDNHLLSPDSSPPYSNYDFLMSKIASPLTLTPPLSPTSEIPLDTTKRESVIMRVENRQVIPATEDIIEHVCRWENCYR